MRRAVLDACRRAWATEDYNSAPSLSRCEAIRIEPASTPPVKLHATTVPSANTFNAYGDDYVEVNAVRHHRSIVVMPERPVLEWPVATFDALDAGHFGFVAGQDPELVVFGSGMKLRFVHPRLLKPLIDRGIGVETMDVHAACRTYNILMAEGRRVAAALLIEPAAS